MPGISLQDLWHLTPCKVLRLFAEDLPQLSDEAWDLLGDVEGGDAGPHGPGLQCPSCPVGQRGAVEPGTQGDVPAAQRLPQLLTVHPRYPEGEYSGLLAEGEKVDVKITDIDMENKKVSLSIRALLEEPEAEEDAPAEE